MTDHRQDPRWRAALDKLQAVLQELADLAPDPNDGEYGPTAITSWAAIGFGEYLSGEVRDEEGDLLSQYLTVSAWNQAYHVTLGLHHHAIDRMVAS